MTIENARSRWAAIAAVVFVLGAVLSVAAPAQAAYPGANGKIVLTNSGGNREIFVTNTDGTSPVNVTNNLADDVQARWSPDGSKIIFASNRTGNYEIYTMNPDGTSVTQITNNPAGDRDPDFSRDGSKIVFWSDRDGNSEIYVMNADGSQQTRLTTTAAPDQRPAWSPDGSKIAFWSDRDGNREIYVMNADGSQQTRLTNNPNVDAAPDWSPYGSKIAFSTNRDGNTEIYVMNADGSQQTRLTNNPGPDAGPGWAPDGTKILFQRIPGATFDLWSMSPDGSNQTQVTNDVGGATASSFIGRWQPLIRPHDVGLVEGGIWQLRDHKNGAVRTITFGTPTDVPIMGDWNCDGVETPGLFRQQKDPADPNLPEGLAYYRNDNAPGVQVGQFRFVLGNPGDIPLAGDFNGDGCDSLSVYRPSEQKFYIADKLPPPIPLNQPLQAFNANKTYVFGVAGDKPFVGDFNGDGTETIGLHRESTGLIYYLNSHPTGSPPADVQYTFGDPGDRLVAGDWVIVDRKFSPALWRSSNATFFFRDDNAVSFKPAAASFPFGTAGSAAIPVSGVMGLS